MKKHSPLSPALRVLLVFFVALLTSTLGQRDAYSAEVRFALVIGNDDYKSAKLATPANDAGLVAEALQAAGFSVTGAHNLDQATLRETLREFLHQVADAGPDAVAVVYLAGFGVQFEGENFFVPVDADLERDIDVPVQAIRVADLVQPLATLPAHLKLIILDAARQNPFAQGASPLAGGLAIVDPPRGMAMAFNAAPGTVGSSERGPYGAYATAFAEMIAAGGLNLDDIFTRVRLRVSEITNGAEVPWYTSQAGTPFMMTERGPGAPPPPPPVAPLADLRAKPMRSYGHVEDAYAAALALDSVEGYEQFLAVYPNMPLSNRVAAMLAVRREALIWRRSLETNTPGGYWSYLHDYPNGPHAADARRRLVMLNAPIAAPPNFVVINFGFARPPAAELAFLRHPVAVFAGPEFVPPPPPPAAFLPPRPREFVILAPPPPAHNRYVLPAPAAPAVHAFVRPPANVSVRPAPPGKTATGRPAVVLPAALEQGRNRSESRGSRPANTAPAPSTAAVKPASPPPNRAAPVPTTVRPVKPTEPETARPATPSPAAVKPVRPAEPPAAKIETPHPPIVRPAKPAAPEARKPSEPNSAAIKPSKPAERETARKPAATSPATVKPAKPAGPHETGSAHLPPAGVKRAVDPAAHPDPEAHQMKCPAGKTAAIVNGHPICR